MLGYYFIVMRNFFRPLDNFIKAPAPVLPVFSANNFATMSPSIIPLSYPKTITPVAPSLFPIFTCESKRREEKMSIGGARPVENSEASRHVNTTGLADFSKHASLVPRIFSQNVNSLSYYACSNAGDKRGAKIRSALKDYIKAACSPV